MNDHPVFWTLDLTLDPEKVAPWRELLREIVAEIEAREPGTLTYRWSISEDKTTAQVFERYADPEAALAHMKTFSDKFASRFFAPVRNKRLLVYGDPGEELREEIKGFDPIYLSPITGLNRGHGGV